MFIGRLQELKDLTDDLALMMNKKLNKVAIRFAKDNLDGIRLIDLIRKDNFSIEAIEDDQGVINVCAKVKNNNYYLVIEDNGIGMTKDILSKIGNPFFTTKKKGTGLGVSLVYEIVEAHHGKIEYDSQYGKGTKVTLKLPLYE